MSKILEFKIEGAGSDRLKVDIGGRTRPDLSDHDDGNWVEARIEIRSGAFAGVTECSLRTEDFAEFRGELARLTDDRNARAAFKSMEGLLMIELQGDGSGRLSVGGQVGHGYSGNRLQFQFNADQGATPMLLQSLDAILEEYPVK